MNAPAAAYGFLLALPRLLRDSGEKRRHRVVLQAGLQRADQGGRVGRLEVQHLHVPADRSARRLQAVALVTARNLLALQEQHRLALGRGRRQRRRTRDGRRQRGRRPHRRLGRGDGGRSGAGS